MAKDISDNEKLDNDVFIPDEAPDLSEFAGNPEAIDANLADDEDLAKQVNAHLYRYYEKYKTDRDELEEIWATADWMFKCGQDEARRESERTRADRQADDLTKTKAQKVGSTMFFKQVRAITALFVAYLTSKKDPYTFRSRYNPDVFGSDQQADDLARQHNLLMRWSRDQEKFVPRSIELLMQLVKYGNLPIYSRWVRRVREVRDRWPTPDGGTVVERRTVISDNRPTVDAIPNENFYADQNIGDIQKQNCIIVRSLANITDILGASNDYTNIDRLTASHVYQGRTEDDVRTDKEDNQGYASNTSDINTGTFLQFDAHALLPIDETKPKGKRWDAVKHPPKRFWVTVIKEFGQSGVCLRIQRNPDPDDEYPFEMLSLIPDDADKLYKVSLAEILRGNYTEATTAKAQSLDAKTLNNNRPMKAIRGEVHVDAGGLAFGKDKIFWCDNEKSLTEFALTPVIDNMPTLSYLEEDSNEAAGTGKTMMGQPMGGRTSSSESLNAYGAANRPHEMTVKYVFNKYLPFHARKGVRQWHIYADDDQIIKITDEGQVYRNISPATLFGDFDVEVTLVDDYDNNVLSQQNMAFVVQSVLPVFANVLNMRIIAKEIFDKLLHMDVTKAILPDRSEESSIRARAENQAMLSGQFIPPTLNEDFDAMLREHNGLRVQLRGMESDEVYGPVIPLLERHIAETEYLKQTSGAPQQAGGVGGAGEGDAAGQTPYATLGGETPGIAVGNQIAAREGAMAGPAPTPDAAAGVMA